MISQEILKRAAAAGAVGAAVLGGAVWMTSKTASPEAPCTQSEWSESAEVSYVPAEELAQPEVRKAPPPGGEREHEVDPQPADVDRAEAQARREAMRRAIEQLAEIKRMKRRGDHRISDETIRHLESRIDRAIRTAVDRTESQSYD